jgi:hypothetical protein
MLLAACLPHVGCADNAVAASGNSSLGGETAAGALAAAASGTGGADVAASSGTDAAGAAASGNLSFAKDVYERVIRARCAQCHSDAPSFGGLAMFPGAITAYTNLVGMPSGGEATYKCRDCGLLRVQPGAPERSLLYLKLTLPPCGSKMPPAAFGQVTAEQVEMVRLWIAQGAAP